MKAKTTKAETEPIDTEFRQITADELEVVAEATRINPVINEEWHRQISRGDRSMIVAFEGVEPVGRVNILWIGADEKEVVEEIGVVPMVNALHVNENKRGRRHGLGLMRAAEDVVRSRQDQPQQLALGVEPDNTVGRRLYKKLGYKHYRVGGSETFKISWPEYDMENRMTGTSTIEAMLMIKDLSDGK